MLGIISCSLNEKSRSRLMAREAERILREAGQEVSFLDLQDEKIGFYPSEGCFEKAKQLIDAASGILLAVPVYNFTVNSACKAMIEHCGAHLKDKHKVVGLMASAGGQGSYMAPMEFLSTLMLDFRCLIVPRYVYALGYTFENDTVSEDIVQRIEELTVITSKLAAVDLSIS